MSPFFPTRRRADNPSPALESPGPAPILMAPPPSGHVRSADQAVAAMLSLLSTYLVPSGAGLPDAGVTTVSVAERTLGLGNRRGTERAAGFAVLSLKGGRIEAVVRFQLWAANPVGVDTLVSELQDRLLAARTELWNAGFLVVKQQDTGLSEQVSSLSGWRKTTDFKVLYEYRYRDLDGAESLIARIPIDLDPEEPDSPARETTMVRDKIMRWDDQGAEPLSIRGSRTGARITGLAALAYLPPGFGGAQVTLARLDLDNPAAPTTYPDMDAFLAAVTDPSAPEHHGQVVFADLDAFLAAFTTAGDPIPLGDWDEDGVTDEYRPAVVAFARPLRLGGPNEVLRISYQDSTFSAPAVLYLRLGARPLS
ncbi:hypothetical protein SAMN05660860_00440 [Geoalkalibacter ferrihydriticus]|uniref:Uncharacterized protein n=1 Tax=Geoalkalibacter ferrihydriticus TaxID=392333 RepID=A0A1G9JGU2_9BACT|nr:hypothetical protein [Geoalkalibacter ferrihydriticus]SDL36475.1 hypothetical protein SAMN05660860_00440 [Geoalkalibacter ferrihydriticus]